MRGQKSIIDYRREGKKPAAIFIEAGFRALPSKTRFDDPEQAIANDLYPVVQIEPDEMTKHHDFRFVIGCSVHVHGFTWSDEFIALVEKIAEAKPSRLVACCINDNDDILEYREGEFCAYANA